MDMLCNHGRYLRQPEYRIQMCYDQEREPDSLSSSKDPTTLLIPSLPPQHRILPPHPLRARELLFALGNLGSTHQRTHHSPHYRLVPRPQEIRKTVPLPHCPCRQRADPMPTALQQPIRQQTHTITHIYSRISVPRLHPFPFPTSSA